MKKLIFVLLIFCCGPSLFPQSGKISPEKLPLLQEYEDTLGLVAFMVINDSLPENRFAATKKLIKTLVQALKIENSFQYPFEQMRSVSIQYAPDSTFRIFTWQLYVDVDDYRYFGTIQMNSPKLKLFPLIDRTSKAPIDEQAILSTDKWQGALYYNIHQFDAPAGRNYLLFGFNGNSLFNKKKLVEVLRFENGDAKLGAPVFVHENPMTGEQKTLNRIVKEYSAESSFRLNYDETFELIIFDHLVLMGGNYGQGPTYVPDGTYEGYRLQNGRWFYVEKVFHETLDEAPRPHPVLDGKKIDILGKSKNKK